MHKKQPAALVATRARFRGIVTTMVVMALSLLIVRDLLVRRWSSPPPAPDVTRRLP